MQLTINNLKTRRANNGIGIHYDPEYVYENGQFAKANGFYEATTAINNGNFISMELTYPTIGITSQGTLGEILIVQTIIQGEISWKDKKVGNTFFPCAYIFDINGAPIVELGNGYNLDQKNIMVFKTLEEFLKIHFNLLETSKQNIFYYHTEQQGLEQGPKK